MLFLARAVYTAGLNDGDYLSGWLLLGVIVFLVLLNLRKKIPVLPLGSAAAWLQFHIYAGWLAIALFFQLVCLGWLIFRAETLGQVGHMLASVFGGLTLRGSAVTLFLFYSAPLIVMQGMQLLKRDLDALRHVPAALRGLIYSMMFYGILLFGNYDHKEFIYFQF